MDAYNQQKTQFVDLIRPFVKFKGLFFLAFLSVVFTVCLLTFTTQEIYEAEATLLIQQRENNQQQNYSLPNIYAQKYLIKNQIAILKSRSLAQKVIKDLEKQSVSDSLYFFGNRTKKSIGNYITQKILHKPIEQKKKSSYVELVSNFNKNSKIATELESNIIHIKFKSPDPEEAAFIVNNWVKAYRSIDQTSSDSEYQDATEFLKEKVESTKEQLRRAENRLAEYQENNQLISLDDKTTHLIAQLSTFESRRKETLTNLDATREQLHYLQRQLDANKKLVLEETSNMINPELENLQRELSELEIRKAGLEAQILGEGLSISGNNQISQMKSRIEGIRAKIIEETRKLIESDLKTLDPLGQSEELVHKILELQTTEKSLIAENRALKNIVEDFNQQLTNMPQQMVDLVRLEREVQVNSNLYVLVRERYEAALIDVNNKAGLITVLDYATPPLEAVYPKKIFNLFLALVFGGLLGIGIILAKDFFEDHIHSIEDLKEFRLDIIGCVPSIKQKSKNILSFRKDKNISRAKQIFPYLMIHVNGNYAATEAYRSIRTLLSANRNEQNHTFLFTSPGPSEGKSTTIANIAIATAQRGVRTLLIDTDLRRPVLDVVFTGSRKKAGFTKTFSKGFHWRDAIRETSVKGLFLMPAGIPVTNSSELLGSKRMQAMLAELKKEFAVIFFDSPPLVPVTDASVLATMVDGIVLVVQSDKTTKTGVQRSLELLNQVHGNVIGTVVTGLNETELYGYSDYYRPYHSKEE